MRLPERSGPSARARLVAARVGAAAVWLLASACGPSDPPRETPEGTAVAITRALIARDFDAFKRLMRNPNAAILAETGARPRPGSYAAVLVREGEQLLRAAFDRAVAKNLSAGELRTSSQPGPGGAVQVTVRDDTDRVLLDVLVASPEGRLVGLDLRVR